MHKSRREIDQELRPSVFTRKATVVLAVLSWVFHYAIGFSLISNYVGQVVVISSAVIVMVWLLVVRDKHTKRLQHRYTQYYRGSKWLTPAGEDVLIAAVDFDGMTATVQFEDGYRSKFSLWTLTPTSYHEKVPSPDEVWKSDNLLMTVSKTRWRHVDGRVGVVRAARRDQSGDDTAFVDYITLKTATGTHEFERNYLTPAN